MAPSSRDLSGRRRSPTSARAAAPRPARAPARAPAARRVPAPDRTPRPTARTQPARPRTVPRPTRIARPLPPIRLRLVAILIVMVLAFGAIGVRLFDLQARDRAHLVSLGLGQRVRTVSLPAERGSIFDRNGNDLAVSVPQTDDRRRPARDQGPGGVRGASSRRSSGVDQAAARAPPVEPRRARSCTSPRKVDDGDRAKVRKLDLTGISYRPESKRFYPADTLAGPVIGFVGTDNNGLGGLEYALREDAARQARAACRSSATRRAARSRAASARSSPAQRGPGPRAHPRPSLQCETEQELTQGVERDERQGRDRDRRRRADRRRARDGVGRRRDRPSTRRRPRRRPSSNRPLTDVYEPGSTNKVITMAGAIEEGLVVARHRRSTTSTQIDQRRRHRLRGRRGAPDRR